MVAQKATRAGARKNVFKATFTRFANKRGSRGRPRFGGWRKILMQGFARGPEMEIPDPVSLAIFASIGSAQPRCARAPPESKSTSQHLTKRLPQYFAPRSPKPLDGAPRIN
jgi:hypothetical protein